MNSVYETDVFTKVYVSSEKSEQLWIDKIKDNLAENLDVGKPLRYYWFREKKLGNKRLFYIINTKSSKVLIVAFGDKKEQQKIIDHVITNKERYLKFIE